MSSVPEKLEQLHDKIKTLTVSTNEFKESIKVRINDLKPKIDEIARRAKACSFNDQQALDKRKELEELLAQKDELFKSYIKKDDLEKEGYLKTEDIDAKIQAALADLEILINDSQNSNSSIEKLIGEIEEQLTKVESEISSSKTETNKKIDERLEKKTDGDALDILDDDESLGGDLENLINNSSAKPDEKSNEDDDESKPDTPVSPDAIDISDTVKEKEEEKKHHHHHHHHKDGEKHHHHHHHKDGEAKEKMEGGKSRRTKKQKTLRKRKTIKKKKRTTKKASKPRSRRR